MILISIQLFIILQKGKFDLKNSSQNIPLDFVKWDLLAREESIKLIKYKQGSSRNNTAWNKYLSGVSVSIQSSVQSVYGPLLTTNWDQNGFYEQYCQLIQKLMLGLMQVVWLLLHLRF